MAKVGMLSYQDFCSLSAIGVYRGLQVGCLQERTKLIGSGSQVLI